MNADKVLELIHATLEEYKSVLCGDFKILSNEICNINIKSINISGKDEIDHSFDFVFIANECEVTVTTKVKRDILSCEDNIFNEVFSASQRLTRITLLSSWKSRKVKRKTILEYLIDIDSEYNELSFIKQDEFHRVYPENCEELNKILMPSCELFYFFDVVVLSLVRSSILHLSMRSELGEIINSFRNSMIENMIAEMCSSTESEGNTTDTDSCIDSNSRKRHK